MSFKKKVFLFFLLVGLLSAGFIYQDRLSVSGVKQTQPLPAEYSETKTQESVKAVLQDKANISFVIQVQDYRHAAESAQTVSRLLTLFEQYKVKAVFLFSVPVLKAYEKNKLDVIEKLKNNNYILGYHIDPPHPAYQGFGASLTAKNPEEQKQEIQKYETQALDMKTGGLVAEEEGGLLYLTHLLGKKPEVVSLPSPNTEIKGAYLDYLKLQGVSFLFLGAENFTKISNTHEEQNGLLVMPNDFATTRWRMKDTPQQAFWWNMLDKPYSNQYNPTQYLKEHVGLWRAPRAPYVTIFIQESDFYRQIATSWAYVYFEDRLMTIPKKTPFDVNARDASRKRTKENQAAIWQAFEEMISFAVENYRKITPETLLKSTTTN